MPYGISRNKNIKKRKKYDEIGIKYAVFANKMFIWFFILQWFSQDIYIFDACFFKP